MTINTMTHSSYDFNLVILSIIIAVFSAYTSIDLAERIASQKGTKSLLWLVAGAVSLGIGIWSMHFIGMLALSLPIPIHYDAPTVELSILPAIGSSGLVLLVASRSTLSPQRLVAASVLMGGGITTTHHMGMSALRLPAALHYNSQLVGFSVLISIVVSMIALWLIHKLQHQSPVMMGQKIGAAISMGFAIPMMHYTAMEAVRFIPTTELLDPVLFPAVNATRIASSISIATFLMLGLALIISSETKATDRTRLLSTTLVELQKSQMQLIQTEKMASLGQLVAGVAHEINNPVNFINGNIMYLDRYTQTLLSLIETYQTHYPNPPESLSSILERAELDFLQDDLKKLIQSLKIGSDRIQEIVLSLRSFSRLDESDCIYVNLYDSIDDTLLILKYRLALRLGHPAINVVKHYPELPMVQCYAGQLNQVFMSLITNAIDACEDLVYERNIPNQTMRDPTIWISTELIANHSVKIMITDNGQGIPENVRSRIFDPFFTTKPVGKGTGLGLSISYQIVTERHHGRIWCDSTSGIGTKFVIEIPIHQPK